MIVNINDKSFQTRSDKPNSNWMGDGWYAVKDGSELANKIIKLTPRFDFVLDENGELVEVVEIPKTQEELNQERAEEIRTELESLDHIINRATEDLYTLTELSPYESTKDVINRKIELRNELKLLEKGEM